MSAASWFWDAHPTAERIAELARQYPIGAYLTVTQPFPFEGWIEDRTDIGIHIRHPGGSKALLTWFGLDGARVDPQ